MSNQLKTENKVQAVSLLCEGNSIRSIERVTEIHRDTIMRLHASFRRDQRALSFAPRASDCPCPPLNHARSTPQNRALVTSGNGLAASAAAFRLRLDGGVALRLRFAKRFSPLSASLSPLADRRPKPQRDFPSLGFNFLTRCRLGCAEGGNSGDSNS
jgi:hypothetical protein